MGNVNVIIPVYKAPEKLDKCLKALKEQLLNGSTFVSVNLQDNNEVNLGFAKAVNIGLRQAYDSDAHEYAIILNQDCYLAPNAVQKMVDFMDAHPKCFMGSIKQISDQNDDMIIHGGTLEAYPYGRHVGGLKSKGACAKSIRQQWANMACVIVRLDNLLDVGLMDENFFLVAADSDWSFTARSRGYEVWYIAEAECVHEQGVSAVSEDKFLSMKMTLDVIYFRNKWIGTDLYRELTLEVFD